MEGSLSIKSRILCEEFYFQVKFLFYSKFQQIWKSISMHTTTQTCCSMILVLNQSWQFARYVINLLSKVVFLKPWSLAADTTLNTMYTVGSSVLWVHTFLCPIFIHFNSFSSILTNFIHFSFIIHPIYLYYIILYVSYPHFQEDSNALNMYYFTHGSNSAQTN
jgi:hypothetical protein